LPIFSLSGLSCAGVVLLFERFRVEQCRAVTALALISYSVYLIHYGVFSYFILYRPAYSLREAVLSCAAAVVISLGLSCLLYAAVERPFMAFRDRRAHRSAKARVHA
jgi:peptidoglycan/LPS O-acetylase OafA/YrhL